MTFSLEHAQVYDLECFPNVFTFHAQPLNQTLPMVWEISQYRDDRRKLMEYFNWLHHGQIPMIAFNSIGYDYRLIHAIMKNPQITYADLYRLSKSIIDAPQNDRFKGQIWASDRFAPQIDLFKIHHFDNKAKTTNLKALQINMRLPNVVESAAKFDTHLTQEQIERDLIPYGDHDVVATKIFAQHSMKAIKFRIGLIDQFGVDVLNYNDTKIGSKILESRLGDEACFYRDDKGRKQARQSPRNRIPLADCIFPYIKFTNPEFQRVHAWLMAQTLTPDDLEDPEAPAQTKGVFKGLVANVGGIEFYFGTGGIHASVRPQHVRSGNGRIIRDIDVASLYPSIAIVNGLHPEHLPGFAPEYAKLPKERKEWQAKTGKKGVEANSMKLASNGTYGNSNNKFSPFYDPKLTMTITINGQLMLCMLAELLVTVPTLQLIQANTDGITYIIDEQYLEAAKKIESDWQAYTMLVLEDAEYSDMWIRDVNNYIARPAAPPGTNDVVLKQKGAYWHPASGDDYADSISESQPPAWHKDLGNVVSIKAAVAAMVDGIDPATYIRFHSDPYDFMCRIKVGKSDKLMLGQREMQKNCRYYVAKVGDDMVKISPPAKGAQIGDFKRKQKISDQEYNKILREIEPGTWDGRIHTANKGRYEMRHTSIEAGYKIAECNDATTFRFDNINYDWYIAEANKLIIR